jgi:hypothetical protein
MEEQKYHCKACLQDVGLGTKNCPKCGKGIIWPTNRVSVWFSLGVKWRRLSSWEKILGLAGSGMLFLIVVGVIASQAAGGGKSSAAGSGPNYSVSLDGNIDSVQTVGLPVDLNMTATNNGDAMSHLVLDFDGLGSWVINSVKGCNGDGTAISGFGNPYDFGYVAAGGSCSIDLALAPNATGTHTIKVSTYCGLDSSGAMNMNCSVSNYGAAIEWNNIAIDPA